MFLIFVCCCLYIRLPNDDLAMVIVEKKSQAVGPRVSEKDDFFIHTLRMTIAEMIDCSQVISKPYN